VTDGEVLANMRADRLQEERDEAVALLRTLADFEHRWACNDQWCEELLPKLHALLGPHRGKGDAMSEMVICRKCGVEFERWKKGLAQCRPCRRAAQAAWLRKATASGYKVKRNPDTVAEYESTARKTPRARAVKAANQRRRHHGPERHKIMARVMVHDRIKSGKLARQSCEVCGNAKVDAHHDDYARPLDVRWLCRRHHREHHARIDGKEPR
jgi:hypothetical protein